MPDESTAPKYPILDEIEVPESVIANWQVTVDLLAEIAGVPAALIMRVHAHDIEVFVASHSPGNVYHPGETAPLDTGLYCETVMGTQCELLVPNAVKDPEWDHNPDITLNMISYCGLPLTWPKGELFGTICILDKQENAYSPRTHQLLERFRDSIQFSLDSIYTAAMERKQRGQAEDAVKSVQTQAQLYLDLASIIIVAIDADQRVTLINLKGAELLGYPQDEIIGMNWFETFVPERLRTQVMAGSRQLLAGEIAPVEYFDNPVITRSGEERMIAWHNTVLRDDAGNITGTLSAGDDITDRRHAEDALQDTVVRLRTVLETLPIGVLILDTHGQIVQSNGHAERIYSGAASLPEPLQEYRQGRVWWTATGQTVEDDDWPSAQALRQGAVVTDQEIDVLRVDGGCANTLETAAPLRDAQGKITGAVVVVQDITGRKLAEDALRASEANYRALFDSMMDAFVKVDMTGRIIEYNPAYQSLLGYSTEELRHLSYLEVTPERWRAEEARLVAEQVLAQGYSEVYEKEYRRKDGTVVPVELRTFLLRDANGQPSAMWAIVRDITERKQAEAVLQLRDAMLDAFFANSPGILNLDDDELRYLKTDSLTPTYFGLDRHTIIGMSVQDLAPDFIHEYGALLHRVLETGASISNIEVHTPVSGRPGEMTYWLASYFPVPLPNGKRGLGVMGVEITDRKQMEQTLQENQRQLSERNQQLEGLFASAPAGMALFAAAYPYQVLVHNRVYQEFWAEPFYSQGMVGKYITDYAPLAEESGIFAVFRDVATTGQAKTLYDFLYEGLPRGKTWWNWSLTPVYQDGQLVAFAHMLIEVTPQFQARLALEAEIGERQRAENAVHTLNAELEQRVDERTAQLEAANREMEAFTYSVSHDLRAPLRAIDGFSKAILEDYADKLDEEGREDLAFIRDGAQQMGKLIDDLLRLSRIGRAEMRLEPVDLSAVVQDIAVNLQQQEPDRQVEWQIAPDVSALGDQPLLRIMLENLLSNAWKFTSKCAVARIAFTATPRDGETIYAICDNGAGFDMAYMNKLFVPFQRLHTAEEYPGTGIGLAIVLRVINRHGGRIWAEGAVGQGATFYFTLPERRSNA